MPNAPHPRQQQAGSFTCLGLLGAWTTPVGIENGNFTFSTANLKVWLKMATFHLGVLTCKSEVLSANGNFWFGRYKLSKSYKFVQPKTFGTHFWYTVRVACFTSLLRRLAWISCHKWVLSYFATSCSGTLHHTTILFNREITLEVNSMKFCLVTYIFLKLFSKIILLVTTVADPGFGQGGAKNFPEILPM